MLKAEFRFFVLIFKINEIAAKRDMEDLNSLFNIL